MAFGEFKLPALLALIAMAVGSAVWADSRNQVFEDFTIPMPLRPDEKLVIGLVGGWERWDHPERIVRRIALDLRDMRLPGVFVETVENHKVELAQELVRRAWRPGVKLVVFGQSLGGRETARFLRWLHQQSIPVEMAVIIDAVGREDYTIPPNVKAAANLFQRDTLWPVVGTTEIRAADPAKTTILGNWQYRYPKDKAIVYADDETNLRKRWMGGHLKMEYDPEVWAKVKELLLSALR